MNQCLVSPSLPTPFRIRNETNKQTNKQRTESVRAKYLNVNVQDSDREKKLR